MRESECFICNNTPLIFAVYECALEQGYDANWQELGCGLFCVEVYDITRSELVQLVDGVRSGGQQIMQLAS